jgi:hypothetical protein
MNHSYRTRKDFMDDALERCIFSVRRERQLFAARDLFLYAVGASILIFSVHTYRVFVAEFSGEFQASELQR